MKLNKITQLEEADFVCVFAELLNHIMCNSETYDGEYTTFAVITKDTLVLSRMRQIAQTAFKGKITRQCANDLVWTNKVHVHFSTPSPTAMLGYKIDIALLDISTIEGIDCARTIIPIVTASAGRKVIVVKKAL